MGAESDLPKHLTYCMNIHPAESWDETFSAIRTFGPAVKKLVSPSAPFGLGLRLGARAVQECLDRKTVPGLRSFLDEQGLYAFTLNGFPYGSFHAVRVKEAVYEPDWRSPQRLLYTQQLADLLADLIPDGVEGSISTVPVGFGPHYDHVSDDAQAADNLLQMALYLSELEKKTGKIIHLGLEPEPSCRLETTPQAIAFFNEKLFSQASTGLPEPVLRKHLGICLDTCHVALAFEDPAESLKELERAGIRISKIQISAALEVDAAQREALAIFEEPVYLHQVRQKTASGVRAWLDLPGFLADTIEPGPVRVHFHVPLFWNGGAALRSTNKTMTPCFWKAVEESSCSHLEIETYTFDVLPPDLKPSSVSECIAQELDWVRYFFTHSTCRPRQME